jgi:hypothetical protein
MPWPALQIGRSSAQLGRKLKSGSNGPEHRRGQGQLASLAIALNIKITSVGDESQ